MEFDLEKLAEKIMEERGLDPHLSKEAARQLDKIQSAASSPKNCKDLRNLLWCSIDNDDSRDLDQLTYAEKNQEGLMMLWIAIADVDALIHKDTPIDQHARFNTTSVYTPAKVFPMLPDKLSTNLTSLNENEDRVALVTAIKLNEHGEIASSEIFQALVRNRAQLTYSSVGPWLEGKSHVPEKVKNVSGLQEVLLCQHQATQILQARRHFMGALTLESPEAFSHNFADLLIEHFMIAANHAMANYFLKEKLPGLRRVLRTPKRWDKIITVAASYDFHLPSQPDSKALESFLLERRTKDPDAFPDLSLTIIKLLGRGEYIVETVGEKPTGHFGLALSEYTHSTAPNRRFPDLISQRQCKASLKKEKNPYSLKELQELAVHCTQQEDAAVKIERHLYKSSIALSLSSNIGSVYPGIVTGAGEKGTWVRIFHPSVEGKIVKGFENLDVGDRIEVKLASIDVAKGFIDFQFLGHRSQQ